MSPIHRERQTTRLETFVDAAFAFALLSFTLVALNARVRRMPLEPPLSTEDRAVVGVEVEAWGILACIGVISAVLALVLPPGWVGVSVWIWMSLAFIMPLMSRRWNRVVGSSAARRGPS